MTGPLQLLTPSGPAGQSLVIGSGCPEGLAAAQAASAGPFDLVIVAPDVAERGDAPWLRDAAQRASSAVAPDGIVYVIAPAGARRRLITSLERNGLSSATTFVHLPSFENTRVIAPARTAQLRYGLRHFATGSRRKRLMGSAALRLPGGHRLLGTLADAAVALRRPSAPSMFEWLPGPAEGRSAVIVLPLSLDHGAVSLHEFAPGGREPVAVDTLLSSAVDLARRNSSVEAARVSARAAGAETPDLIGSFPEIPLVRQGFVRGTSGQLILDGRPRRLEPVLSAVGMWLARWNEITVEEIVVDRARLDQWILEPLSEVKHDLPADDGFGDRLQRLCARVEGSSVPLVWAHGDLTMSNILLRRDGRVGVIDWETARPRQLPLHDLYYALADAVAATERYSNRVAAVQECFAEGGSYVHMAAQWCDRLAASVGVDHDTALLSFHSCWLQHAANERRTTSVAAERPFAHILRWVAESDRLRQGLSLE